MARHVVLLRRDTLLSIAPRALLQDSNRVTELPTAQALSALPSHDIVSIVMDAPVYRAVPDIKEIRSTIRARW